VFEKEKINNLCGWLKILKTAGTVNKYKTDITVE